MARNTCALLIAGDEERFVKEIDNTRNYLLNEAGFDHKKTWTCNHSTNESVLKTIERFVQEINATENQDAVVVYSGHGLRGSFCPHPENPISYQHLARTFKEMTGRIIFINYSCHSGSAIPVFREFGLLPKRGSIIASAKSTELSYNGFLQKELLDSFRQRKPYKKKEITVRPATKYKTGIELHEERINPLTGKFETTEKITYDWKTSPAIVQHPQRCGLDLDHLLFPQ